MRIFVSDSWPSSVFRWDTIPGPQEMQAPIVNSQQVRQRESGTTQSLELTFKRLRNLEKMTLGWEIFLGTTAQYAFIKRHA